MRTKGELLFSTWELAITQATGQMEHYAMEVGRIRDLFESKLQEIGGHILYRDSERLANTSLVMFPGVHGEQITEGLRKEGIFAHAGEGLEPAAVSFTLGAETTEKEVLTTVTTLAKLLERYSQPKRIFTAEDAAAKGMRLSEAKVGKEISFTLSALIDEEDGIIADVAYRAFAPPALHSALDETCKLLLRKNYLQAQRLSADLIEKKLQKPISDKWLNLIIDAIDEVAESCMDIPIEDVYVAPPEMGEGERTVYPNWEQLTSEQKKNVIAEVMDREVRPYVELDAGGVEVVRVEENRVTFAYSGNCTSCFSATGATLDAIGNILRHKIYPDLMVIPDTSLLQG